MSIAEDGTMWVIPLLKKSTLWLIVWGGAAIWASASPPAQWAARGIGGGGAMYSPTINPANPSQIAIACDMSPQFTSSDGGKTWSLIDFRQLQSGHECAIRFTKDPAVAWAIDFSAVRGSELARPTRSTDGGKSWRPISPPAWPEDRAAYVLYADFDHPGRAVVSANYRELWITLDGGNTFEKKLTGADRDAGLHLAGAFFDGDLIYLGLNDGLYFSKDGGKSFAKSEAGGLPPRGFISSFAGGKAGGQTRLFCVIQKDGWAGITGADCHGFTGIYVLDPGQSSWVKKTTGLSTTAAPFFVRMAANDPDTAYVAGGNQYPRSGPSVYRTSDGGATWTDVFQTDHNQNIAIGWAGDGGDFAWSFPEYALGFDVCLLDKNHLLLTDLGMAHASDDGGRTWRQVYTSPVGPGPPGQGRTNEAYVGVGLEVTSIWQIHWFDAANLFVCATDIRAYRSIDAARSWSFNYAGHTMNTMYRIVADPAAKNAFAAVSSVHDLYQSTYLQDNRIDSGAGGVLVTSDGGSGWKPVGHLGRPVVWVALDPRDHARLYAAVVNSKTGGIYATEDAQRGAQTTWTRLPAPPRTEGHPYNIHVLADGVIVCTYSGRRVGANFTASSGVFVSSDGGRTWDDRSDPRMRLWTKDLVLDPEDQTQSTWYVGVFFAWGPSGADGGSGLYRTTDCGKTWMHLEDSYRAPSGTLNVESCGFDPAHPGQFFCHGV
jgi:photosystem II stability/assembly factor-like uncharacterized protein